MPFTTGTAATPTELLNKINTHLVANGWTRLRGETDLACASPKAARYWRLICWRSVTVNFRGIQLFHLRTTAGGANQATVGANFSSSSTGTGSPGNLVAGGSNFRSANINQGVWTVTYDFGSATTIREFVMQGDTTANNSPQNFAFQWSNDGLTWTTLIEYSGISWASGETKTFTVTDGYLHTNHVSSTQPRRSGSAEELPFDIKWSSSDFRAFSEDYWAWQGPGYDSSRRVYVHARSQCRPNSSTHVIEWDFSIGYDSNIKVWNTQEGNTARAMSHLMDAGTVTFWLYSNSKRIVLVTRSGAQDYTSSYVGFMSAFGTPDDYPFPLCALTTMNNRSSYTSISTNAQLSSCADPGFGAGIARLWNGTLVYPENRPNNNASNLYLNTPNTAWVWPYHFGSTNSPVWPFGMGSDYVDYDANHIFDYMRATAQNELPLIPCIVMTDPYGNIGVLDGVFAIPSGSILTPTQVITIGGQDYRVFPNRTRREPIAWFCVRED